MRLIIICLCILFANQAMYAQSYPFYERKKEVFDFMGKLKDGRVMIPMDWGVKEIRFPLKKTRDGSYQFSSPFMKRISDEHEDYSQPFQGMLHKPKRSITYTFSKGRLKIYIEEAVQLFSYEEDKNGAPYPPKDPITACLGCKSGTRTVMGEIVTRKGRYKGKLTSRCEHIRKHTHFVNLVYGDMTPVEEQDDPGTRLVKGAGGKMFGAGDEYAPWIFTHKETLEYSLDGIAKTYGMNTKDFMFQLLDEEIVGFALAQEDSYWRFDEFTLTALLYSYWQIYKYSDTVFDSTLQKHNRLVQKQKELKEICKNIKSNSMKASQTEIYQLFQYDDTIIKQKEEIGLKHTPAEYVSILALQMELMRKNNVIDTSLIMRCVPVMLDLSNNDIAKTEDYRKALIDMYMLTIKSNWELAKSLIIIPQDKMILHGTADNNINQCNEFLYFLETCYYMALLERQKAIQRTADGEIIYKDDIMLEPQFDEEGAKNVISMCKYTHSLLNDLIRFMTYSYYFKEQNKNVIVSLWNEVAKLQLEMMIANECENIDKYITNCCLGINGQENKKLGGQLLDVLLYDPNKKENNAGVITERAYVINDKDYISWLLVKHNLCNKQSISKKLKTNPSKRKVQCETTRNDLEENIEQHLRLFYQLETPK